jgi:hypothetical protein
MDKIEKELNPHGCDNVQCLVDNGEIEFSLVTFGTPRVMNDVGRDIVEKATFNQKTNGLRSLRVEMIFDPVPHMAGPKREMKEEHAHIFKPVGEVMYLAPAFGEGKSMNTASEYMAFWKDQESAVLEVQGLHALESYSLAIKGGTEGNADYMFKMTDPNTKAPAWALTEALATDKASYLMKLINMHIYDDKDHFGKMMRKMGGGGMFDKLGDMFKGGNGNPLGNLGDMFKGGNNPLGNMFGGDGKGMPDMSEMMKMMGGGKGMGGMPFDDIMGGKNEF